MHGANGSRPESSITGDDWKRSLAAARIRRREMPARISTMWHNFGDGHRYDEIYDDHGRRFICLDCGANLASDRIRCSRVRVPS